MNIEEIKADLAKPRPFYGEQPKISEWKAKEALLLAIDHLEVEAKWVSGVIRRSSEQTLKRIEEVFNR